YPFNVHRDRREGPYVALSDHISSCRRVFFEAIGGEKGVERCDVVPRLKQQDVVRVLLRDRDTKLAATRLLHSRSAKLLDRCHELVDLCGDDVELDNKNVEGA